MSGTARAAVLRQRQAHPGLVPSALKGAKLNALYPSATWPTLASRPPISPLTSSTRLRSTTRCRFKVTTVNGHKVPSSPATSSTGETPPPTVGQVKGAETSWAAVIPSRPVTEKLIMRSRDRTWQPVPARFFACASLAEQERQTPGVPMLTCPRPRIWRGPGRSRPTPSPGRVACLQGSEEGQDLDYLLLQVQQVGDRHAGQDHLLADVKATAAPQQGVRAGTWPRSRDDARTGQTVVGLIKDASIR